MGTPKKVKLLFLEQTALSTTQQTWDKLMRGATRANSVQINLLVREHLPALFKSLNLHSKPKYDYFKTKRHLIMVHNAIEYFLRYEL